MSWCSASASTGQVGAKRCHSDVLMFFFSTVAVPTATADISTPTVVADDGDEAPFEVEVSDELGAALDDALKSQNTSAVDAEDEADEAGDVEDVAIVPETTAVHRVRSPLHFSLRKV